MTNYERIQIDKEFLAYLLESLDGGFTNSREWMEWLDTEQREVTDEREHKEE